MNDSTDFGKNRERIYFFPEHLKDFTTFTSHLEPKQKIEAQLILPNSTDYKHTYTAKHPINYKSLTWNGTSSIRLEKVKGGFVDINITAKHYIADNMLWTIEKNQKNVGYAKIQAPETQSVAVDAFIHATSRWPYFLAFKQ